MSTTGYAYEGLSMPAVTEFACLKALLTKSLVTALTNVYVDYGGTEN